MPEKITRVAKLSSKLRLHVRGYSEQSQGGNIASVLQGIQRLDTHIANLRRRDVKSACDSNGDVVEDLFRSVLFRYKDIVQGIFEAKLPHEATRWNSSLHPFGRGNHFGQV